jgi:hypothetical protein
MAISLSVKTGQNQCGCACDECKVEVRSVTAILNLEGYAPFICDGGDGNGTGVNGRYLRYTIRGPASIQGCGGWSSKTENSVQTWTVDPFTGLSCRSGDERNSVLYLCSDSGDTQCTDTTRTLDCGEYTEQELNDYCVEPAQEGQPAKRKIVTETLSDYYTLEEAATNVDTMLARIGDPTASLPPGVAGYVVNGTGHSALSWDPEEIAWGWASHYRFSDTTGGGYVSKTKLFIKFLKETEYILDGETYQAQAGETLVVNPPAEQRNVEFSTVCRTYVPTNLNITYDGTTQDKIAKSNGQQCTPFIGPDCKEYNTKTTKVFTSSFNNFSGTSESEGAYVIDDTANSSSSESITIVEKVGPQIEGCYSSETTDQSGSCNISDSTDLKGYDPANGTYSSSNPGSSFNSLTCSQEFGQPTQGEFCFNEECYPISAEDDFNCCVFSVGPSCPACSGSNQENYSDIYNSNWSGNRALSYQVSIAASSVLCYTQMSGSGSYEGVDENNPQNTFSGTLSEGSSNNTEITFSNTEEDEQVEGEKYETTLSPNYSGCASYTEGWNFISRSSANIGLAATFNAPASDESKTYETWFHYILIKNDFSNEDCPVRTVTAHNQIETTTSTGGSVTVQGSISIGTPTKKSTVCPERIYAYTFKK